MKVVHIADIYYKSQYSVVPERLPLFLIVTEAF